jgi:exopolysaccharide biosynthesis polyprenyl glycosylphosphotransferase
MICLQSVVFSRQQRSLRPILIALDLLLVWAAFEFAYFSRSVLPFQRIFFLPFAVKAGLLLFAPAAWLGLGLWMRSYDRPILEPLGSIAARAARQSLGLLVALVVYEYSQRLDLSRPFLALVCIYSGFATAVFRLLLNGLAHRYWRRLVLPSHMYVAGTGEAALRIGGLIEASARFGLCLDGFLGDQPGQIGLTRTYPVYPIDGFSERLRNSIVDEVIVAVEGHQLPELEDFLLMCEEEGVRTRLSLDFFPHRRGSVSLERLGPAPLLTLSRTPSDEARLLLKRITDIITSVLFLVCLSPLFGLVALAVRFSSKGPVIFRQTRCGLNGRRFTLYKFRTMVENAEELLSDVAHLNVKTVNFKIPDDPRLTPVGRLLRKFSLDELPQLWNVLKGEMSLVGPRPAIPSEVEQYRRWQRRRLRMRPGLTCLWAVEGRDALDFEEAMRLDLAYIDSWSLAQDWIIMFRTVPRVLTGRGAN